jgi:replicative DNA helicase
MNEQLPVPAGGPSSEGEAASEETGLLPHNIEAEQQLLGAILSSNDVYDRVEDLVKPDHFFDPVHRELF